MADELKNKKLNKTKYMYMNTTITIPDTERMAEIESEREATMGTTEFQNWMVELNVSRSYTDREGILRGNDMMREWGDWSGLSRK